MPEDLTPAEYIDAVYETQQLVYALAALRANAPRVSVAYCLLERPDEPVITTYTQPDAPDVANRINALAHGIVNHEFPVTPHPHRDLCGECPGRHALCSHPQSLTLRPPPAPWPGILVRRNARRDGEPVAGPPPR